jgi:hypothetical protein
MPPLLGEVPNLMDVDPVSETSPISMILQKTDDIGSAVTGMFTLWLSVALVRVRSSLSQYSVALSPQANYTD